MRRTLLLLAAVALLGYGGAIAYLVVNETELVFHPAQRTVETPSRELQLRHRPVSYPSTDGTRLSAWIVPAAPADSSGMWLLICHGNYGNIGFGQRPEFYSFVRDLGLNILAFDYRGFGESAGAPDEDGVYEDALASFRYLTDSLRVPASQVVIFGHSLGSGVATELATRVDAAALVLEGAFTSVVDRGQELYPWLPVGLIATQRFESLAKMLRVAEPKLLLHSPEDEVIPFAHGERLRDAMVGGVSLVAVRGGHEDAYRIDKATYFGALATFIGEVSARGPAVAGYSAGSGQR